MSAQAGMRIGAAAEAAGVSTRTLRYYEQRGLLAPSSHTAGGERRYTDDDVERTRHIRDLAELLGADLEAIRGFLGADDELAALRAEYRRSGQTPSRQLEILEEAGTINAGLQDLVDGRLARLAEVRAGLRVKAARYAELREVLREENVITTT